jgi:hypothetical protein
MCFKIDPNAPKSLTRRKKAYKVLRIHRNDGTLISPHKDWFHWEPNLQFEVAEHAQTAVSAVDGTLRAAAGFYVFDSLKGAERYALRHWGFEHVVVECAVEGHLHTSVLKEWYTVPGRGMTFRKCTVVRIVEAKGVDYLPQGARMAFQKMRRQLNRKGKAK